MKQRTRLSAAGLVAAAGIWAAHAAAAPASRPASRPTPTYQLVYRDVAGSDPLQSVFVIVTPDGDAAVTTYEKLTASVEQLVKGPATLRWMPSDERRGDDRRPLDDAEAERSLAAFCRDHGVTFVHVPAG